MISIIGAGRVGSALAFLLASEALDDIVLVNKPKDKAIGESLDIMSALPPTTKISITGTDDMAQIKKSNIVVITASVGKITDERTDLLPFNFPIIKEISNDIRKFADDAKIIVVTNPVDIITYQVMKETEFNSNSVIGMGSSLDSTRFRYILGKELAAKQNQIEGIVIGEHGNTMVPVFSSVKLDGKYLELNENQKSQISIELKNFWRYLIAYKGESVFGAAKSTCDMIYAILLDKQLSIPAQVYLNGEYGFDNLCMGVPVILNGNGIDKIIEINLSASESELLGMSALKIKEIIKKMKI